MLKVKVGGISMKILIKCISILIVLSLSCSSLVACKNNNSKNLQTGDEKVNPRGDKQSGVTKGLYVCENNGEPAWYWIKIEDNNKFIFNRGVMSYRPEGEYEVDGNKLLLKTDDLGIYEFQINDDRLIFIKSEAFLDSDEMVFIYTNKSLEDLSK